MMQVKGLESMHAKGQIWSLAPHVYPIISESHPKAKMGVATEHQSLHQKELLF